MKPITPEQQARVIERWKSAMGLSGRDYVPLNDGSRRSAAKRALLRAIAETARRNGERVRFPAKF